VGEEVSLDLPNGVSANAVMDFLRRGHGYTWKTVSKEPVLMVLGHPSKSDHPEVVILKNSLVVNSSNQHMRARMGMMLEVLARQVKNGVGGRV
jgi:hypothetical protein